MAPPSSLREQTGLYEAGWCVRSGVDGGVGQPWGRC